MFHILIVFLSLIFLFFFFNDTATTEIYTLSLHDALPIFCTRTILIERPQVNNVGVGRDSLEGMRILVAEREPACTRNNADRKSTRLNSSHGYISYAVFCLKKKKRHPPSQRRGTLHGRCVC